MRIKNNRDFFFNWILSHLKSDSNQIFTISMIKHGKVSINFNLNLTKSNYSQWDLSSWIFQKFIWERLTETNIKTWSFFVRVGKNIVDHRPLSFVSLFSSNEFRTVDSHFHGRVISIASRTQLLIDSNELKTNLIKNIKSSCKSCLVE